MNPFSIGYPAPILPILSKSCFSLWGVVSNGLILFVIDVVFILCGGVGVLACVCTSV